MIEEVASAADVEAFWSDGQDGGGKTFTLPAGDANDTDVIPSATDAQSGPDALPALGHVVTVDLSLVGPATVACLEPPSCLCHAVFACDCESWGPSGDWGGVPWHDTVTEWGEKPERHFGKYDQSSCVHSDWLNEGDGLRGEVSFAVRPEWADGGFTYYPVPDALPALVAALAKVTAERDRALDLAALLEARLARVTDGIRLLLSDLSKCSPAEVTPGLMAVRVKALSEGGA